MSRQDQLGRIAEVRERRAERERLAARQRLDHAAVQRRKSDRQAVRASECADTASRTLLDNPADPQALLWRTVARERSSEAAGRQSEAREQERQAQGEASDARRLHERACERREILLRQAARDNLRAALIAECRGEEP